MKIEVQKDENGFYFTLTEAGQGLPLRQQSIAVRPEFKKRAQIGGKSDLLARAIGHKKNRQLKILDLTAGLGQDSFHMACLGHQVTALERNEQLYKVVNSNWLASGLAESIKLNFVLADAEDYLKSLSQKLGDKSEEKHEEQFDVIYFDPMFPEKKKSAKSGKAAQLLQEIGYSDSKSEADIVRLSYLLGCRRIVVKRPRLAPQIGDIKTMAVYTGQAVRYDVVMGRQSS